MRLLKIGAGSFASIALSFFPIRWLLREIRVKAVLDSIFDVAFVEAAKLTGWSQAAISNAADEYVAPIVVSAVIVWIIWHIFHWVHKPTSPSLEVYASRAPMQADPAVSPVNTVSRKPVPDTTVKWAFDHLCGVTGLKAAKDDTRSIWRQLRQAAYDGKITVWGRPESAALGADQFTKPVEMVPPEHWRDYDFDELRCLVGDDETSFARTKPDDERKQSAANGYADLRLNKQQVQNLGDAAVQSKVE
jgi:hypothetical protein